MGLLPKGLITWGYTTGCFAFLPNIVVYGWIKAYTKGDVEIPVQKYIQYLHGGRNSRIFSAIDLPFNIHNYVAKRRACSVRPSQHTANHTWV